MRSLAPNQTISPAAFAAWLQNRRADGALIVGLTGSVAVGKSTLAGALADALAQTHGARAEIASTDGFLFPNAVLAARDLLMRKGFPETYDAAQMAAALTAVRTGAAHFPVYSHALYDIDPASTRTIAAPDVLIVEGLGLPPAGARAALDVFVYLDADEADLERWFLARFHRLRDAARTDASSFYARFLAMTDAEADAFARQVWADINLPNLRTHIAPTRDAADVVLRKGPDHTLHVMRV